MLSYTIYVNIAFPIKTFNMGFNLLKTNLSSDTVSFVSVESLSIKKSP